MKKIITIILVIATIFAFTGCGKNNLIGVYTASYDLTSAIAETFTGEIVSSVPEKSFIVNATYTISEDGTYKIETTEASVQQSFGTFIDSVSDQILDFYASTLSDADYQGSLDDYFAETGITAEEVLSVLKESLFQYLDYSELSNAITSSGKWKSSGDKFYTAADGEEFDESEYDQFEVKGYDVTFVSHTGGTEDISALYPIKLVRKG